MSRRLPLSRNLFFALIMMLPSTVSCQTSSAPGVPSTPSRPQPMATASATATATATPPAPAVLHPPTPQASETPDPDSTPVEGVWTVSLDVTKDAGMSHVSGYSIKLDSSGAIETSRWQNGIAAPERRVTKSQVALDALKDLKVALGQPRLSRGPLAVGQGSTVLIITRGDVTRTFRTGREAFVGPPGKVQEALLNILAGKPE